MRNSVLIFIAVLSGNVIAQQENDTSAAETQATEVSSNAETGPSNDVVNAQSAADSDTSSAATNAENEAEVADNVESSSPSSQNERLEAENKAQQQEAVANDVVRVNYVPEFIREQIKAELKEELKKEVVDDVLIHANEKRWGVQDSWPSWLNKVVVSGDVRARAQLDTFDDDNAVGFYRDLNQINRDGGSTLNPDQILNTTEDRERMLLRMRFALEAKYSDYVDVGFRIVTGDPDNPVSANVNMAEGFSSMDISADRAYVNIHDKNRNIEFLAGRMPNPWVSSSLVWDADINFSGVALKTHWKKTGLFFTTGAFPINESRLTTDDAWLQAAQLGWDYSFSTSSRLIMGVALYNFDNLQGIENTFNSQLTDYTAPRFFQKGNTVIDIRNDLDPNTRLLALASDYDEANFIISYTYQLPRALQIRVLADYVENINFNEEIPHRDGGFVEGKTSGYLFGVRLGTKTIDKLFDWSFSISYRELERDAVVDAFTDSEFHLGGTDAEGYELIGSMGIAKKTWLTLKVISSDEIDEEPFGIDTYHLSLNTKF